jgi:anti-anti-sigma factor
MSASLHIDLEEIEHKIVLRLDGRLDAATVPILERKINTLIEEKHYKIYLDFLRVDYLSSAGLRLLLSFSKKLKAKKGSLVLFAIGEEVMEIIKLAGFEKILLIFETEQDAFQHVL